MLNKTVFGQVITITLAVGLFAHCSIEKPKTETKTTTTAAASVPRAPDEAKIEISVPDYEIKDKNLASLQSLPMPEVKFVSGSKITGGDQLPEDVRYFLSAHWKQAIKFKHDEHFSKPANPQTAINRDMTWTIHCNKTENKLQESFIDASYGYRKVSPTEAGELISLLNKAAADMIEKVVSL